MRSAYELTTIALRIWLIGCLVVSVVSLSDFLFRRPHGAAALLRRLAVGLLWPIALVSGAGRRVLLGQLRGVA
ncbi:MAG: hypothetical protein JO341_10350 [Gammaproteobacteria bacterium]|nr:hypothetical protein [Gammaproteobacteria bacterium]MBV9621409.1 hypothetical protein [Gammaproteobacteria bacterium]